ncbi:hypothetical protein GUITHDRAFT_147519 [Guillardia theta CCMP2712]|uniref:Queuosine 5'-phosphate N-glycosylase/hydrolase n=1 Tax=Guillardia theta (strain CCMP2712) TaxID=905079 RepID=L1ID34_GUITC|nr:hypothetical protein GUITHDRAFT_147519 [Guillardia theta CCMP2712]EKX34007.1 hypothetical protein GUITHDRAFT_147519 [Guillardia theta CCMP2712]|eukprot:XP_005820987.1 hypothetical protein GUITHDRAFT_147519 [Guillardia theta CCMP2712]
MGHADSSMVPTCTLSVPVVSWRRRAFGTSPIMPRLRGGRSENSILLDIRSTVLSQTEELEELVSVNATAVEALAKDIETWRVKKSFKVRFGLPLVFDDVKQEINFYALLATLSFGSGWQEGVWSKAPTKGVPTRDSVLNMLISLHMDSKNLDAAGLAEVSLFALSQALDIPLTKEKRLDGGPIRQDVPSDYRWLVDKYYSVLSSLSSDLTSRGFKDLADFILSSRMHGHVRVDESDVNFSASLLVERLVKCFETFQDVANVGQSSVPLHRKAQLVCEDLVARFAAREHRLNFTDMEDLTLGSDAETVTWLRKLSLIEVSPALAKKIDSDKEIEAGSREEAALRVAGVKACMKLAEEINKINPEDTVSNVEVWRYISMQVKDLYFKQAKEVRQEANNKFGQGEEEEEKIYVIGEGDDKKMFRCKNTQHY